MGWIERLAIPAACSNQRCFYYSTKKGANLPKLPLFPKDGAPTAWQTISALLDELRSFEGDLSMVRHIAHRQMWLTQDEKRPFVRPAVMPFEHVLDQHCAPEVAYFFEPEHVPPTQLASAAFAPLFDRLFADVTSKNPRRHPIDETLPFFQAARAAQRRYVDLLVVGACCPTAPAYLICRSPKMMVRASTRRSRTSFTSRSTRAGWPS